jgi:hypothetical protein
MLKLFTYLIISVFLLACMKQDIGAYDPKDGPQDLDFEGAKITTDHNAAQKWFGPKEGQAAHYKTEIVSHGAYSGKECAIISSIATPESDEFGNIMQFIDATPFRGKTVLLRGFVRIESASTARAAMWMRVDTHEPWGTGGGFFDNMQDRPITSNQWKEYEIKGPISYDAKRIYIGCMLFGDGKAFFDAVHFEVLTGIDTLPQETIGPKNLDFEAKGLSTGRKGWFAPSVITDYTVKVVNGDAFKGKQYAEISSIKEKPEAFGNVMQSFDATPYRGKTMRFRAAVRVHTENKGSGQMWMRVDCPNRKMGFFDNMDNRPITSNQWKEYDIIGKIDTDALYLNIGCMLIGEGKVDFDAVSFEPTNEKPTTRSSDSWFPAGSHPRQYTMETNDGISMIKYTSTEAPAGFGTYMKMHAPGEWSGKRLKMTGMIRTENAEGWVGMWSRVDGPNDEPLDFDNMHDRPIIGTSDWKKYEIITNVPKNAKAIAYGVLVNGKGTAYFKDIKFEVIGDASEKK